MTEVAVDCFPTPTVSSHSLSNEVNNNGRGGVSSGGMVAVEDKVALLLAGARKLLEEPTPSLSCHAEEVLPCDDEEECRRRLRFLEAAHAFVEQQHVTQRYLKRAVVSSRSIGVNAWTSEQTRGGLPHCSARDLPAVAVMIDEELTDCETEECPTRHNLCFSTVLHIKPRGLWAKDAAVRRQGQYCKQCLDPLHRYKIPLPVWKEARFCYFTGMYYCNMCNSSRYSVIPAFVLKKWDFKPRPVCNDAYEFLKYHHKHPIYRVCALNPRLYERVALLRVARNLRSQLMKLRDVGMKCAVLRHLLYLHDAPVELERDSNRRPSRTTTNASATNHVATFVASDGDAASFAADCYVPRTRRYLLENCELWSLSDLEDVRRGQLLFRQESAGRTMAFIKDTSLISQLAAYSKGTAALCGECDTTVYLKQVRSRILRHILVHSCATCLVNSVDVCSICCPAEVAQKLECINEQTRGGTPFGTCEHFFGSLIKDVSVLPFLVYVFDTLHVFCCTGCGSAYHRRCFKEMQHTKGDLTCCPRCRATQLIKE
ncbi:protein of unknown function (DUF4206), putative [Trypanosoma equiperdum]|uniref:Rubicon Homology domain-containing protein n=1 Tax=Trypanosoma equiperdum TaxID=5694 RepID=A0A1G4I4Y2_TRYEQ|nr:Domain of unknown function (DUF4206), putative [Trypanosoma equiperdum]